MTDDRDPVSHRVPDVSGTPRDPVSHPLRGDMGEHALKRAQSVSREECLLCGLSPDLLADLEAAKAQNRRLTMQLARVRAKHRRFADATNALLTEQATNTKELHTP